MTSERPVRPPNVVDRRRLLLTLAMPFVLLVGASLVSWPWRSLDLPAVGTLTPLGGLLLAGVVAMGVYSVRKGLPIGLITWLPAAQGAIVLLTTGFLAQSEGGTEVAIAASAAYIVLYIMALIVSVLISTAGISWGMAFMSFFLLTQATRFPVFAAETERVIAGAELLTLAAAARAVIEVAILAWLVRRLVEAPEDGRRSTILAIVGLVFAHGVLAGWEDPVLRGTLDAVQYAAGAGWWLALSAGQLAIAYVLIRIRRSWFEEPAWAEPEPEPTPSPKPAKSAKPSTEAVIVDDSRPAAPRPRRRRRR